MLDTSGLPRVAVIVVELVEAPYGLIAHGLQQDRQRHAARQAQPRIQLEQRLECEAPLGEPRMGHREAGVVDDLVPGEQDVEIARARAVAHGAHAAQLALDGQQPVENATQRRARCAAARPR